MVGRPQAGARQGAFVGVQLGGLKHQHNSNHASQTQSVGRLPPPIATAQQARTARLDAKAADIAGRLATAESVRALKAIDPAERQELRQNSVMFTALARRLTAEVR